jgi:hypothetical protein
MKLGAFVSFLLGFIVTGVILAFIFLCLVILTFDLGGGKTLGELEAQRALMLSITLLLILVAGSVARDFIKGKKRFVALGIRVMALLCIIVVAGNYIYNLTIPTTFNKTKWEQSDYKPYHMAATLVKRDTLIGLTKQQVKDLLGQGLNRDYESAGAGYQEYLVEDTWKLTLYFEKDKLVRTELRLPWLGV